MAVKLRGGKPLIEHDGAATDRSAVLASLTEKPFQAVELGLMSVKPARVTVMAIGDGG